MKLWILDADVIIDLLEIEVFEKLVNACELYISSIVINEVKYFRLGGRGERQSVNFRENYVDTEKIIEIEAIAQDMTIISGKLPDIYRPGIHAGELESLTILDANRNLKFCTIDQTAIRVLPFLELEDLRPDQAGIRPKLQIKGDAFRDFIIKEEKEKGYANFINLIGIESPGLTASLAIANYVNELI